MQRDAGLEEAIFKYLEAFNRGDLEAVVRAFTLDAVNHPPVGPAEVRGHRKLRQFFRQTFALSAPEISGYAMDYEVHGDRATVRESWTVTFRPKGAPPAVHRGRALWLAHWTDETWKTHWLMGKLDP